VSVASSEQLSSSSWHAIIGREDCEVSL
jgi:hypothetical protein